MILVIPEQRASLHAADMTSLEKKPEVNTRSRISISHADICRFSRSSEKKQKQSRLIRWAVFSNNLPKEILSRFVIILIPPVGLDQDAVDQVYVNGFLLRSYSFEKATYA